MTDSMDQIKKPEFSEKYKIYLQELEAYHLQRNAEFSALMKQRNQDKKAFYGAVGEFIQQHRQKLNWSQERLGRESDLCNTEIYWLESGRKTINLYNFVKVCRAMKTDFRFDGAFRLEAAEKDWITAYRRRDYVTVLKWLLAELGINGIN